MKQDDGSILTEEANDAGLYDEDLHDWLECFGCEGEVRADKAVYDEAGNPWEQECLDDEKLCVCGHRHMAHRISWAAPTCMHCQCGSFTPLPKGTK